MKTIYEQLKDLVPQKPLSNYTHFIAFFPTLALLASTPQDKFYHAEGDVWTHTQMVCDELVALPDFQSASDDEKFIMFYSALLHDISKPACTKLEGEHITSKGHSKMGCIDVRIDLWKKGIPFHLREDICNIIATHQVPFFAFDDKPKEGKILRSPEFIANQLSWQLPLHLLINVASADMMGRHFINKQQSLADIEKFKKVSIEQNCLYQPKAFASADNSDINVQNATRMKYFRTTGAISPDYDFYTLPGSQVDVLCGLPAVGKNKWVEENAKGRAVLSFDDETARLGLVHGDNVGKAVHMVIDKAKEMLRKKEGFVWNATHLSLQMRNKTLDLLYNYDAEVRLVYLEASESDIKQRNNQRNSSLPNKKIDEMLFKWEVPTRMEAHTVEYIPHHGPKSTMKKKSGRH